MNLLSCALESYLLTYLHPPFDLCHGLGRHGTISTIDKSTNHHLRNRINKVRHTAPIIDAAAVPGLKVQFCGS